MGLCRFVIVSEAVWRLRARRALRRQGSLFEKSSAKTFLEGTAVFCVIFEGEAFASPFNSLVIDIVNWAMLQILLLQFLILDVKIVSLRHLHT